MASQHSDRYIETTEFPGSTHLQVSVYYSKGGVNYFSGRNEARGFYLSVTPVKKDNFCVSSMLFSGLKRLVSPANRYSEKQFEQAVEKSKTYEQELIDGVRARQKSA